MSLQTVQMDDDDPTISYMLQVGILFAVPVLLYWLVISVGLLLRSPARK